MATTHEQAEIGTAANIWAEAHGAVEDARIERDLAKRAYEEAQANLNRAETAETNAWDRLTEIRGKEGK